MKIIYMCILIIIMPIMISAEIEKMIVITGDDVNVRNKADISGKVLMSLPKGKLVEYIKQNEEVKIIKGISGRWIFVNTKRFKNNNDNKTVYPSS